MSELGNAGPSGQPDKSPASRKPNVEIVFRTSEDEEAGSLRRQIIAFLIGAALAIGIGIGLYVFLLSAAA